MKLIQSIPIFALVLTLNVEATVDKPTPVGKPDANPSPTTKEESHPTATKTESHAPTGSPTAAQASAAHQQEHHAPAVDFGNCAAINVTALDAAACQNAAFTALCMKSINMKNASEECINAIPEAVLAQLDPKTVNEIGSGNHPPTKVVFVDLYLKHVNHKMYSEAYFTKLVENNDVLDSLFKSKIPATKLANVFTENTVEKMNSHYCEQFTPDLMKNLHNKAFAKVSPECLGKVKPEVFKEISGGFLREINPLAFKSITVDQVKALGLLAKFEVTVEQMKNLGPDLTFSPIPDNATDEDKNKIKKENADLAKTHPCVAISKFVVLRPTEKSKAFKERCENIIKTSSSFMVGISWMVTVPTLLFLIFQTII